MPFRFGNIHNNSFDNWNFCIYKQRIYFSERQISAGGNRKDNRERVKANILQRTQKAEEIQENQSAKGQH